MKTPLGLADDATHQDVAGLQIAESCDDSLGAHVYAMKSKKSASEHSAAMQMPKWGSSDGGAVGERRRVKGCYP